MATTGQPLSGNQISVNHDYVVGEVRHRGSISTVYAGTWRLFDLPVFILSLDRLHELELATRNQSRIVKVFCDEGGRIRGPHLPDIIDSARASQPPGMIVMRLPEGELLIQLLQREGRISATRTLRILRGVARALRTCRRQAAPHRGPTADRIWLDERGEPTLLAYGEVLRRRDMSAMRGRRTVEHMWHIPPEVYRDYGDGEGAPVSALRTAIGNDGSAALEDAEAAEVWALGALAYHCLAGHHPYFVYPGDHSRCVANMLQSIRIPLPQEVDFLQSVVDRALADDPAERYASCGEFIDALSRAVAPDAPSEKELEARRDASPAESWARSGQLDETPASHESGDDDTTPRALHEARIRARIWMIAAGALLVCAIALALLDARRPATVLVTSEPPGLEIAEVTGHLDTPRGRTPIVLRNRRLGETVELRTIGPNGEAGEPQAIEVRDLQDLGRCRWLEVVPEVVPASAANPSEEAADAQAAPEGETNDEGAESPEEAGEAEGAAPSP